MSVGQLYIYGRFFHLNPKIPKVLTKLIDLNNLILIVLTKWGISFTPVLVLLSKPYLCVISVFDLFCTVSVLVWFGFCFTTLQHILGYFGRGQLP